MHKTLEGMSELYGVTITVKIQITGRSTE